MAESFERQMVAFLLSLPQLTDTISNRLYPQVLDYQKPFPAAVYHIISSEDRARTQDGKPGYRQTRLQLDIFDRDYLVITDLAEALDTTLNGHRFLLGSGVGARGATFYNAGQSDDRDPKTQLRYRHLDYLIVRDV